MPFEWDEDKRKSNLKEHAFDFADAAAVFDGLTATYEDDRFAYGEQRFVTLGLLRGVPVSIVHTEEQEILRVISFRRASNHETEFLFQSIASQLPATTPQSPGEADQANVRAPGTRSKPRRSRHRKKRAKARPS
jgi:uncharacterized DUF497 family protein